MKTETPQETIERYRANFRKATAKYRANPENREKMNARHRERQHELQWPDTCKNCGCNAIYETPLVGRKQPVNGALFGKPKKAKTFLCSECKP